VIRWLFAVALIGCAEGHIAGGQKGNLEIPGAGVSTGQRKKNEDLKAALAPTCGGCHGASTNKPFFASITSFEDLLLYNAAYVVPGDPDKSALVALLTAQGKGSFKQMPPAGPAFAAMTGTRISVEAVAEFIRDMEPRASQGVAHANPQLSVPHRLSAAQVRDNLYLQLGLSRDDFFHASGDTKGDDFLPLREPDDPLPDQYRGEPTQRWIALGGAAHLELVRPNTQLTPSFFQNLTQLSQAWCRMGVEKAGSPLHAMAASPDIKKNIATLQLRMLGLPATDADVERLHKLFLAYQPKSPQTAWVAVCSALIRHPLWLSY
jgi:hypothetical protein